MHIYNLFVVENYAKTPHCERFLIEECAELIQALLHYIRDDKPGSIENVIEEMAHVYVLMRVVKHAWNIDDGDIRVEEDKLLERAYAKLTESGLVNQTKED